MNICKMLKNMFGTKGLSINYVIQCGEGVGKKWFLMTSWEGWSAKKVTFDEKWGEGVSQKVISYDKA